MTPQKQQINFRASDYTRQQLDELCEKMGETQTGVLAIAVDRLWRQVVGKAQDNTAEGSDKETT